MYHNKPPDRKEDDVMPRRDGPENLRILKVYLSFLPLTRAVEFFGSRQAEMNWDLKNHKRRRSMGVWST